MSNTNTKSIGVRTSGRGFGRVRERTVTRSKWSEDVKTFSDLFAAVMRQTAAPRCAQKKYLTFMCKQLQFRGSGFLAQTRNFPIFGLRILGGDVAGDRTTKQMFSDFRMRKNADGIEFPLFLSWYWNRLWELRKVSTPTKAQALEVSRILAVLSFSKFLMQTSKRGFKKAKEDYVKRIKTVNGKLPLEMTMRDDHPLYKEMVAFLKRYGHNFAGERMKFDRRSYSLKQLVGKKPHRPPVPPVYGYPSAVATLMPLDENGNKRPNNLVEVINRWYYSKEPFDAKLCMISEAGGKYRGICPYTSPYAHSINLYKQARSALLQLPGNCNYDQAAGHIVGCRMSRIGRPKVSVDASNFTDTINIEYAAYMAKALGAAGAVHYHSRMRIKLFDGSIHTGCVPLMGWMGTFDLASVLLAFSIYRTFGEAGLRRGVQCGDDFLGYGKLEDYQKAYEFLGLQLSSQKTVVSKFVTIFCGEMFWRGLKVTPVRFLTAGLSLGHRFIGKLISRTRDFVRKCNYSPSSKRRIYGMLKKILGSRYRGYLDFRLSSELGGIPLNLGPPEGLLSYLENNKKALQCALCNIPYETIPFNGNTTHFAHLPLGKPYSIYGLGTTLTPGSWPTKSRLAYGRRKKSIDKLLSCNSVGIADVLLYIYDGTMLKS